MPESLLTNIFKFLGVSSTISWNDFPVNSVFNKNPGNVLPKKFKVYLEGLYCEEIDQLYKQYGEKVANWKCEMKTEMDGAHFT
jgi:hypothetical protein